MTEYVYKLKNGKLVSAYADEKGNISITKEALEIMVNSWNDGYQQGRADAEDERASLLAFICKKYNIPLVAMNYTVDEWEQLKEQING